MTDDHPDMRLSHKFPLRADWVAMVELPCNLTEAEAARFCAFVTALAQPNMENHNDR
jgi:hypothetical protein